MAKTHLAIFVEFSDDAKIWAVARDFNKNSHVCCALFEELLQGHRPIASLRKLNIECVSNDEGSDRYWEADGIGCFHFRPVDLEAYSKLELIDKQKATLEMIRDALLEIATIEEVDVDNVNSAYANCLECEFPLDPTYFDRMLQALEARRRRLG